MWPNCIVVDSPLFDQRTGIRQADEPVLVQAFISELAIEALDMPILGRLARRGKVEHDLLLSSPGIENVTSELRPIVDSNTLGCACSFNHAVQDAGDPSCWQRC